MRLAGSSRVMHQLLRANGEMLQAGGGRGGSQSLGVGWAQREAFLICGIHVATASTSPQFCIYAMDYIVARMQHTPTAQSIALVTGTAPTSLGPPSPRLRSHAGYWGWGQGACTKSAGDPVPMGGTTIDTKQLRVQHQLQPSQLCSPWQGTCTCDSEGLGSRARGMQMSSALCPRTPPPQKTPRS